MTAAREHPVYVYGVVSARAPAPEGVAGVGGAALPVRRVDAAEVAALVSDVGSGTVSRAGAIRAHWRVLDDVSSRTTVLPLRFGTVMDGDAVVRDELLARNEGRLAAALTRLEGKVQLTLRAFYDEQRLLGGVVRDFPEIRELRDRLRRVPEAASYYDRIRLGELVAAAIERQRERDTEFVLNRLGGIAHAARCEDRTTQDTAVIAAFLVDRVRVDEFSAAVQRLVDEVGERMRIRYVGPSPAYSFADEEAAAEEVAWAS
jgi:gas vesicle protein GvpL/GvpF